MRELHLGDVAAQLIRETTWLIRDFIVPDDPDISPGWVEGKISERLAGELATRPNKGQESQASRRQRAVAIYRQLKAAGEGGNDIYLEVANRLGVSRTTAYRHLRDADVLGRPT